MNGEHQEIPRWAYTLDIEINRLTFDPKYPKDPKAFGAHIRKARMDGISW
ncbi:MAG: hypothetical protein HYZ89_06970 [Candidatus Omnitrophica bacterium]|nr:hypothetical protein [Candidatus Omnitrophota bacterium]